MKLLNLLILVFAFGVVACEGTIELGDTTIMPELPSSGDGQATVPAGLNGGALYQQHCGACHGADATGGPTYDGSIRGVTPVETIIVNGAGLMPPIPLQSDEIAAIQDYLLGGATAAPESPDPSTGSTPALQVYASQCAACHGPEGLGTPLGTPIRLRDPDLTRFTVRQGRNGLGNPTTMPIYTRDDISDEQLTEIIDWLDAFPNPTTGEGLYNQFCSNCHGVDGRGGTSFEPVAGTLRAQSAIREGHGAERYVERRSYMPSYTEDQISDAEIVLIEQYIRSM